MSVVESTEWKKLVFHLRTLNCRLKTVKLKIKTHPEVQAKMKEKETQEEERKHREDPSKVDFFPLAEAVSESAPFTGVFLNGRFSQTKFLNLNGELRTP